MIAELSAFLEVNVCLPDLSLTFTHGTIDFTLGVAFLAVLLAVTVLGMVAVEATLAHAAAHVTEPPVAVTMNATGPTLAVAIPANDATRSTATVARLHARRVGHGHQTNLDGRYGSKLKGETGNEDARYPPTSSRNGWVGYSSISQGRGAAPPTQLKASVSPVDDLTGA